MNINNKEIIMHTLKINVEDNVYTHLKFFLESLNNKGIEVIEDKI